VLDTAHEDLDASGLRRGRTVSARALSATTCPDAPRGGRLYDGGHGALSLAVNRGSPLAALCLLVDDEILIAPAWSWYFRLVSGARGTNNTS